MSTPEIRQMLVLSTSHLPEQYGSVFRGVNPLGSADGVIAHKLTYGFLMWVPDDPVESSGAMTEEVPPEILAVQIYARSLRCDYVMFDSDGDTVDDLPTWEW
jgi:hypothetical protein